MKWGSGDQVPHRCGTTGQADGFHLSLGSAKLDRWPDRWPDRLGPVGEAQHESRTDIGAGRHPIGLCADYMGQARRNAAGLQR
jgi:hypothetical protein